MAKLRRTLLIGLGGTGITSILNAKKMFIENYGQVPPMIGFLGIDTDEPGLREASVLANDGSKITLNESEKLAISVPDPILIYQNYQQKGLFDWMPKSNVSGLQALSIGAGQMRSNGRFAITVNESTVKQSLNNKITEINNARIIDDTEYSLLGKETEIHVVFSLGGGTGSGTFLNVAYLIRRLYPYVKLSGYAVLPDVFRNMVSGAMSSRVKSNGKGAIMDLDYLAHLTPDSDPVQIKWFQTDDRVQNRPFDALYFIDNRNENYDTFDHVDSLCQMIALAIVTSVGELGIALDSVSDNVSKLISDGSMDIKNKKAWAAGFGCAEIIFDSERLAKIYARKAAVQIVNKMLNGGCDDPTIIANNWFDNTKIRENQGKDDVIDYFMSPTPPHKLTEIDNLDAPLPECQQYLETRAVENQTKLDEKFEKLTARVDESLTNLMNEQANRECGIFLCSQILMSILHLLELCDSEMEREKDALEEDLPKLESGLKTACSELSACMDTFLKRGKKDYIQEVLTRTERLANALREIGRRKMARQFYSWLKERVNKSVERVNIITRNLTTLRNDCNNDVQRLILLGNSVNFFQFDLSAEYAEKVSCPLTDIVFNDFAKAMKTEGGIASFSGLSSSETKDTVMRFVRKLPKVQEYLGMSVDDAIDKLSEEELNLLIINAVKKSLPLLPYTLRGFNADLREKPVECYYIGVASKKRSRLANENYFKNLVPGAKDVQFSEVGLKNKIIIYRQLGVLPAFTIKSLDNYETEYENWEESKPNGSHWDDTLCKRMVKERYNLVPKDDISEQHLLQTWVSAIIYNLVSYNTSTGMYQIKSRGLGGKPLKGWLVDMGTTRQEAFRFLEDNLDILGPEIERDMKALDIPGPDNPIRVLTENAIKAAGDGTYLENISKCPIPAEKIEHYPAEEDLINKEITYILDNIA